MAFLVFPANEERALTIQDLAKAGYKWISLVRTSTTEQKKSIDQQEEEVNRRMVQLGFGKPVFTEKSNVSGAKEDREQMQNIFEFIEEYPEPRNLILVIRDASRFARNQRNALNDQYRLEQLGVYLYFSNSNILVGGKGIEQGANRAGFSIELLLANYGKFDEVIASKKGREKAKRTKGITGGTGRDTFRENIPKKGANKGKSIFRIVAELRPVLATPRLGNKALASELSNSTRKIYHRTIKLIREEIDDIVEKVGEKGLEEWLNVWDELIRYEGFRSVGRISKPPKRGQGAFRQSEKARALWRTAQGYIKNPQNWNDPVKIGNPEVATYPSPENIGTLEHAYRNPIQYIPQAR